MAHRVPIYRIMKRLARGVINDIDKKIPIAVIAAPFLNIKEDADIFLFQNMSPFK